MRSVVEESTILGGICRYVGMLGEGYVMLLLVAMRCSHGILEEVTRGLIGGRGSYVGKSTILSRAFAVRGQLGIDR